MNPLLEIKEVTVERPAGPGEQRIGLRRVSLVLSSGEIVVLAGESGSGKSLLARLIAGVAGPKVKRLAGTIEMAGRDLFGLTPREWRKMRCGPIAVVAADPAVQFPPDGTVRQWLRDGIRRGGRAAELREEKEWSDYFYRVGLMEPERILPQSPGDLSPLTVKRLLVMRAMMVGARLLLCDEPTAGLDGIAANRFLELLGRLREETGMGLLLSTGSLRGVENYADQVVLLYDGAILESGSPDHLLREPRFAYTREFRACDSRLGDLSCDLPVISRRAVRDAEEAIHEKTSSRGAETTG
ncbi:MAG: ATP-binding cassette domain-containing protein [Verrucomicrobiaceae bacterium]|nr:ATP-binding cassette domain-containing protein [Verrucomicrobiaceae bacterium]